MDLWSAVPVPSSAWRPVTVAYSVFRNWFYFKLGS